jgi:hypothetical protein
MALKRFRKIKSSSKELDEVQDNVADVLNALLNQPLTNANFLPQVALLAGNNDVGHGLGRRYRVCLPGLPSVASSLSQVASPDPTRFVRVVASVPCSVDLVVL